MFWLGAAVVALVVDPFKANNSFAFYHQYRKLISDEWRVRHRSQRDASVDTRRLLSAHGFEWNAVGVSFAKPPDLELRGWLENLLLSQRAAQRRASRALIDHELFGSHRGQLSRDGYVKVADWGLSAAFLEEIRREATSLFDDKAVQPYRGRLKTMDSPEGQRFLRTAVADLALKYLGPDATLAGYELLLLTEQLTSKTQYPSSVWHHDRCGKRLKAFLFLHDITDEHPTAVAVGSHDTFYYSYHALHESRFDDDWVRNNYNVSLMTGPAGGGFVFDTNTLHRGGTLGAKRRRLTLILEVNQRLKSDHLRSTFVPGAGHLPPCPSNQFALDWPLVDATFQPPP